jgi:hypothetical protein
MNPVHTIPPCFPKIHSNIIFPSMPRSSVWSLPFRFSAEILIRISHPSYACYMPHLCHPPWLDNPNNILWSIRVMKSKYSLQHPVLKHPQFMFSPWCEEPSLAFIYEGVSKSGRLERELEMVQLFATRCSCIAILWVSLVSFAAITLCVASQRVFIVVYFVIDSVRKLLDTFS